MIPFLVGIVDKESALYSRRGCGELDEDLDCKLAVRILLDIVNEMVASQPSTQLKNVSESVDEDARIKHYNWILLLSPRTVSQLDIHFNQQDVNTLYGTMIHGLSRRNLITEALAILQRGIESPAHQYTPDVSNVSPVLECMIRKQQMTKAFQFLEWLLKERKGFVVDEKSLQVVYWGCLRSVGYKPGKRSVQRSVLREMGLTHVEYQYSLVSKAREVFLDGIGRLINIVGVDGERDLRSRAYSAMLFEHVFLKEREISELVLGDATKDGVDVSANTLKAMKELYPINSDGRKLLGYEIRRIESDITMIDTVPSKEVHVLGDLTDLYDMEEFNDYEYWTKG
ncbi:hypothetical protein BDR26DRAFT_1008517 [Obelidium mucronatum]|nr:hypothetical protein BDR26DRAFT_1008517 [Obelidium mucronatum]